MELKYRLISADDHVYEHPQVWTARLSKKWGDHVPHLETAADGSQRWLVAGAPVELPRVGGGKAMPENRVDGPMRWDEVPAAAHNATERLKAMDADGVDYSVLYPTIGGMAGERFGRLDDSELETACAQAYNDWLIEEWASVSPRFVPQCIVPIWPMERTVAEIRRAVALGHKGVIFPASPMELRNLPHINEPAYDP
ncbi:MAG TPA: amidohydrolase family protein, partial [Candidatus Binatus sp.]|nr:amidohydrolase family protein [Candidatus Binatus sp.]